MQEQADRSVNIGDDSLPGPWNLVSPSAPNCGNPTKPGGLQIPAQSRFFVRPALASMWEHLMRYDLDTDGPVEQCIIGLGPDPCFPFR